MIVRCLLLMLAAATATAAPVRVRYPEGPARGLLVLTSVDGKPLAHGELEQWMEGPIVVGRLAFEFADGSVYEQVVRFSQRRVFRLESYRLRQHGPSFTETVDTEFDRNGHYRVTRRAKPDAEEERAEGRIELPDDVMNGLTSIVCKNVMPDGAATVHLVAFQPKPLIMDMQVGAEDAARFHALNDQRGVAVQYAERGGLAGLGNDVMQDIGKAQAEARLLQRVVRMRHDAQRQTIRAVRRRLQPSRIDQRDQPLVDGTASLAGDRTKIRKPQRPLRAACRIEHRKRLDDC